MIPEYAMGHCASIREITISDTVTEIGECAFAVCTGLERVTIPDSVTQIGKRAFNGCDNLTIVVTAGSAASSMRLRKMYRIR